MALNTYKRLSHTQFNVRVSVVGNDIFDLTNFNTVKEIYTCKKIFSRQPVVILADPFLFVCKFNS